jgi:ferric-dicitrate binding protein FerR (iron transport regulator)
MNQGLIHKYLKGEASELDKIQMLEWIEVSDENRKEYMRYRRLYDSAIWSESDGKSINRDSQQKKRLLAIRYVREFSKVAAVIVIAVSMALFVHKSNQNQNPVLSQTIEVPQGQYVNLILSDGTKVSLNSNSKLIFPTTFTNDERTVKLDGEGYFEVAHNAKKPFHVITNKCDIKVLGTTFNVLAYSNSDVFETSLLKGSVQISNLSNSEKILLKPNEKAEFRDGKLLGSILENENDFLWRTGVYVFQNEPLIDILQKMESYYQTKIIINNVAVGQLRCTGKFKQKESIEEVIQVLRNLTHFNYKLDPITNEIIIM